jgi:Domain of unknown function (DUF4287)
MTKQKSFKGRVRARMDKTSESYTAARRQLLAKATAETQAEAEAQAPEGPVNAPGVKRPYSDAVIQANTGKRWDEWFAVLDRWGAAQRPHAEIARWVGEEHGVGGWWAQGVTVAYEQARGAAGARAAARRAVRGERLQDGGRAGRAPVRGVHRPRPA